MVKYKKKYGHEYPTLTVPMKSLQEENLFINPYWNEWNTQKDSLRVICDNKKIVKQNKNRIHKFSVWDIREKGIQEKNKKKLIIRKKRKLLNNII